MLTRLTRTAIAAVLAAALLTIPAAPARAVGGGDPGHPCAVDPTSVACTGWLADEDNPPASDPSNPACLHLGAYVPCRSPTDIRGEVGWWLGDVALGRGWSYLHRGDPRRIDDPAAGERRTDGCWGYRIGTTGGGTGVDSPGDPTAEGAWYTLLCLGQQPWSTGINLTTLPGFHEELAAWRATGPGPSGDPAQAALNALATLDIAPPEIVTAPPPTGQVPLGMPVWLAVDETDPSRWGRLSGSGCDGSLCVNIQTWVHELEWHLGDGTVIRCARSQNVVWEPGMRFLEPWRVCHHYYQKPSRDLPDGRYPVEVTAHWRTYWQAPSLGLDGYLDHTQPPVSTSIQVIEIHVLVTR